MSLKMWLFLVCKWLGLNGGSPVEMWCMFLSKCVLGHVLYVLLQKLIVAARCNVMCIYTPVM